jgi:hypothetical protein
LQYPKTWFLENSAVTFHIYTGLLSNTTELADIKQTVIKCCEKYFQMVTVERVPKEIRRTAWGAYIQFSGL